MSPASRSKKSRSAKGRSPRCKTCGRAIRMPEGWTVGPAVRRHYWAKHPEVMRGKKGRRK